jgi:hypothetical protein
MTRIIKIGVALALLSQGCGSESSNRPGSMSATGGMGEDSGGNNASGGTSTAGAPTAGGKAGSPPTGGAATGPHTVTPCPTDAASVGKWENITPPVMVPADYKGPLMVVNVAVSPQDPSVVYTSIGREAAGNAFGMFKSTDCGATWKKINTGKNAAAIDSGYQWTIVIDPVNSQNIFVSNGYGAPPSLFKSTDGGVNWDQIFTDDSLVAKTVEYNFTQGVAMDPADPQHLAVSFHANCKGEYGPMCMAETRDGGATWTLFHGPTMGWSEGAGPLLFGGNRMLFAAPFTGLFYTEDVGATWKKVAEDAYAAAYHSPNGTWFVGSNGGIIQSKDDGKTWSKVEGAPRTVGLVGDGETLFATFQNENSGQPMYSAPENNPSKWTNLKTPEMKQGGSAMAYDPDHHIIYSSNYTAGLWRMITRVGPADGSGGSGSNAAGSASGGAAGGGAGGAGGGGAGGQASR